MVRHVFFRRKSWGFFRGNGYSLQRPAISLKRYERFCKPGGIESQMRGGEVASAESPAKNRSIGGLVAQAAFRF
jgi:hypothetical protein